MHPGLEFIRSTTSQGLLLGFLNYMTYAEKLKDPRWQKKRLEILNRDEFTCQECGSKEKTLHVHHTHYIKNKNPWEYDNRSLVTLCWDCHRNIDILYMSSIMEMLKTLKTKGWTPGAIKSLQWDIYEGSFDIKEHIDINLMCRG